jgi:MSHA pilin protein MshC
VWSLKHLQAKLPISKVLVRLNFGMNGTSRGFTLIELIAVLILVGILSVVLMSRMGGTSAAGVQAGRDSLIAAFFLAQQTAMARAAADNPIAIAITHNGIDVTEGGASLIGYPLTLSGNISLSTASFQFDKLGRTSPGSATITHPSGTSATVTVEASGYAYY